MKNICGVMIEILCKAAADEIWSSDYQSSKPRASWMAELV